MDVIQLYTKAELPPMEEKCTVIPIERTQLLDYDNMYATDASSFASHEATQSKVLGRGMLVTKGSNGPKKFKVTQQMQDVFNSAWMLFLSEIMESIYVFGFGIIGLRPDRVPFRLHPLELDIKVLKWRNGKRMWQVQYASVGDGGSVGTSANVMGNVPISVIPEGAGIHPSPPPSSPQSDLVTEGFVVVCNDIGADGLLRSPMRRLTMPYAFQNLAMNCAARAMNRLSAPPIITQNRAKSSADMEMKQDLDRIGDGEQLDQERQELRNATGIRMAAVSEKLNRAMNAAANASTSYGYYTLPAVLSGPSGMRSMDLATNTPLYPLQTVADPPVHARVHLQEDTEYVKPAEAKLPNDLMKIVEGVEADSSKVSGVPTGMWGAERQSRKTNDTIMTVFDLAVSRWRHRMTLVARYCLGWIFGRENFVHSITDNWDDTKDVQDNLAQNDFEVQFVGCLDPDVLNMVQDRGMMEWGTAVDNYATYFGVDRTTFAKEQIEVATGRPVREIVEEQRALERQQVETQLAFQQQEFDMSREAMELAQKQAGKKPKPGEKKKPVKLPKLPQAGKMPQMDPASITPTALTGLVTANGKAGAGGRSSALSGPKANASGVGNRGMTGEAGQRPKGTKRKKHD